MRFLKNKIAQAMAFREQNQSKPLISDLNTPQKDNQCKKEEDVLSVSTQISTDHSIVDHIHNQIKYNNKTKTQSDKKRKPPGSCSVPTTSRETKNLVKNYGKAICNFSTSSMATPYLQTFVNKEGVTLKGFLTFIQKSKGKIDGLQHFRELLLSDVKDTPQISAYRKIYREISEVFIKFFSVNWIYHSKVFYKKTHLDFRFKMLRRIQNPEQFTYLKGPKKNSTRNV